MYEQVEPDSNDSLGNEEDLDIQYIATQLSQFCTEYVQLSDQLEVLQQQRKGLTSRQKELSTRITSLMNCSDIDEVNCGKKHKILKVDRKSTSSLNIKKIENIITSKGDITLDVKEQIVNDIKNTRVTTVKQSIKVKKV